MITSCQGWDGCDRHWSRSNLDIDAICLSMCDTRMDLPIREEWTHSQGLHNIEDRRYLLWASSREVPLPLQKTKSDNNTEEEGIALYMRTWKSYSTYQTVPASCRYVRIQNSLGNSTKQAHPLIKKSSKKKKPEYNHFLKIFTCCSTM